MVELVNKTPVIEGLAHDKLPYEELLEAGKPAILKGVASDWPLVRKGLQSAEKAIGYLKSFDSGRPVVGYTGGPEIKGRYFYNKDMTGLNFDARRVALGEYLDRMRSPAAQDGTSFYIGSTELDIYLPGIRTENDLVLNHPMFERSPPMVNIWAGTRTIASAHYDIQNNLACCMVGRRRFTLFPPDQVRNLYPGPLEPTPGGQVVSMVDFDAPDFDAYPCFRDALAAGESAELEPGDVLFYPPLWWHHVEGLESFNVMINYWWGLSPPFIDTPMNTLLHGLVSLRDRPEAEKRGWKQLFEYYVFGPGDQAGAHLPEHARGALGPMDDIKARRLRAQLLNRLNR